MTPLSSDDVFYEVSDPAWVARLSLPLVGDYHDNVFVPNAPPCDDSELLPRDALDSSSFSTFGKCPTKTDLCLVVLLGADSLCSPLR